MTLTPPDADGAAVRAAIGLSCAGRVLGTGFRTRATIGRAVRLGASTCFGLRPPEVEQTTQGARATSLAWVPRP